MPRYVPEDSLKSPRFTGIPTFARLPYVRTLDDVDLAVIGVPFDTATTYRTGGRFGPNAVRSASVMIRPYNPAQDVNPFEVLSCVDYGDIAIVPGFIERSYAAIERDLVPVVEAGVIPLLIGGDHSCTLPHLRATRARGPIAVVMFDSHTDAWDSYFGEPSRKGWWTSAIRSKWACAASCTTPRTGPRSPTNWAWTTFHAVSFCGRASTRCARGSGTGSGTSRPSSASTSTSSTRRSRRAPARPRPAGRRPLRHWNSSAGSTASTSSGSMWSR